MNNKIIAIGIRGAGKKSYMVGMYGALLKGINGISIIANEPEDHEKLINLWGMINSGTPLTPSDSISKYSFSCTDNFERICDFDYINVGSISGCSSQLCMNSASILIFIDGEMFQTVDENADIEEYEFKVIKKLRTNSALREVMRAVLSLSGNGVILPPIGIIITKCELVPVKYGETVKNIIYNEFRGLIDGAGIVMPISVTLGGDIKPGFAPNPYNIEQPIAFSVLSILTENMVCAQKHSYERKLSIANSRWGIKDKKLIDEITKLQEVSMVWGKSIKRILSLFPDDKMIYVDGQEKKLKDYYNTLLMSIII